MILEAVILNIHAGQSRAFEDAFGEAAPIIVSMKGYLRHELRRCMETAGRYLLLVEWETLEDHTLGFRGSSQYANWKARLHHFYDPMPLVEHYEALSSTASLNR